MHNYCRENKKIANFSDILITNKAYVIKASLTCNTLQKMHTILKLINIRNIPLITYTLIINHAIVTSKIHSTL